MTRLLQLLRTTSFRLSVLYLLLFAICAAALVFYMTSMSERQLHVDTKVTIALELKDLSNIYRRNGVGGVVRAIERRSRRPGADLYIVTAPNGQIIAGNVASLNPGILDKEGWKSKPFSYERFGETSAAKEHFALAEVVFLPNGMRALVGRDLGERERFKALIQRALMIAFVIMGIGAFAIWFFVGRRALKRIDNVTNVTDKILSGDTKQRLPVSGSNDEFDRLSISMNAMLDRIASLNEGLIRVSDNIAHDLKTPLTRLRNKAESAINSMNDPETYRKAMDDIVEESDLLIRIFNALLMISKVEAGAKTAEFVDLNIDEIARDVFEIYEPVGEDAGIEMHIVAADNMLMSGNRELIGQAISNLLDNAIKYTSEAPTSSEGADNKKPLEIWLSVKSQGAYIYVDVEDNGSGVPENKRGSVVERFFRLDESRNKPGTGLGLSLVNAIMKLHNGELILTDSSFQTGLKATMRFKLGASSS